MKLLLLLNLLFLNVYVFGQTRNSNKSEDPIYYENKIKEYGVDFQIGNDYERYNPSHRTVVPTYKQISCMSYGLYAGIVNKKYKDHYIIYFFFNRIQSPLEEGSFMKKITPNWTPNKNYLGGKNCQDDRDKNLIPILSKSDFVKMNADTALCIRVDSNARIRDYEKFNDYMYVQIHKDNVLDIQVCFAYEKEYELEVIEEIKNLWKIIKFK
jgi:hypothetical protein